jgi:hypothetical protein
VKRILGILVLLLASGALAGTDTTPKLFWVDFPSAPASGFVCVTGRNFPASGSAIFRIAGTSGTCTVQVGGGDVAWTTFAQTGWTRGACGSPGPDCGHMCFAMPAASGDCAGTPTGIFIDDTTDSNTLALARHTAPHTPYFVRATADDDTDTCLADNDATACKTIQAAYNKADDGDQIIVHAGTYSSSGSQVVAMNDAGTASQPIMLRGYPGELPFIQYTGTSSSGDGIEISQNYQQVANVEIQSTSLLDIGKAVSVSGGQSGHFRIADSVLGPWELGDTTTGGSGLSGGCTAPSGGMTDGTYIGTYFYQCGTIATVHGIYLNNADDINVQYCEYESNGGNGIQVYSPGNSVTGILVENSLFHDNSEEGSGAQFGCNSGSAGVIFRNNMVYDGNVHGLRCDSNATNCIVYNNLFFNNASEEIITKNECSGTFTNNIMDDTGSCIEEDSTGTDDTSFVNNLFNGCNDNTTEKGTAEINTNPDFVDAVGPTYDFHIQDGGGAIDVGATPPAARTIDFEQNSAPLGAAHDAGAYEFVSGAAAACQNGLVETGEDCDSLTLPCTEGESGCALGGATCISLGFEAGVLTCNANCTFGLGGCTVGQVGPANKGVRKHGSKKR